MVAWVSWLLGSFAVLVAAHPTHYSSLDDVFGSKARDLDAVELLSMTPEIPSLLDAPDILKVAFRTHDREVHCQVALHRTLFHSEARVFAHGGPEDDLIHLGAPPQIAYAGTLPTGGYVRLTLQDKGRFHATLKVDDKLLVVDLIEQHAGHKGQRRLRETSSSGMVGYYLPLEEAHLEGVSHRRLSWGRMQNCAWPLQQLLVGVASDAGFTTQHGGAATTQSSLIAVYNSVNGLFEDQIGVHLTIGAFLIETEVGGPAWNLAPGGCGANANVSTHLNTLKGWVATGAAPNCGSESCGLWHLHTNCNADPAYTGTAAGIAWIGTLCTGSLGYNTGLSVDVADQTWILVGHEIGHNFGAQHTFAEGGIMSYNWATPIKFIDNNQVCNFVQSVQAKCLTPLASPVTPAPTTPPPTTAEVVPATTSAVPSTTTNIPTVGVPTAGDPCACSSANLCTQKNRPGCQQYLNQYFYCYVTGYAACTSAQMSRTCTDAQGRPLYYVTSLSSCPVSNASSTVAPTSSTTPVATTLAPTPPATTSSPSPTTPESTPAVTTPAPTATTSMPAPAATPGATNSSSTSEDDPCGCSTKSRCSTIPQGGCQSFKGQGWCYVKDPKRYRAFYMA
uniref:Secreted protein n=1 Tax=Achlya hypogyna TaxID=1202772 RepID=A0A0A7CP04_ACHHY|nr:secreted protein [Achlya hypogyna]